MGWSDVFFFIILRISRADPSRRATVFIHLFEVFEISMNKALKKAKIVWSIMDSPQKFMC